jgi:hypothetical protein
MKISSQLENNFDYCSAEAGAREQMASNNFSELGVSASLRENTRTPNSSQLENNFDYRSAEFGVFIFRNLTLIFRGRLSNPPQFGNFCALCSLRLILPRLDLVGGRDRPLLCDLYALCG